MKPERRAPAAATIGDAVLLAQIARRELEALGLLYDRYAPALLRYAARAGDPADAEDVVQATFLRVVGLAANFDPSARSARPWLFGITTRVIQERRRAFRRWQNALIGLGRQRRAPSGPFTDARRDLMHGLTRMAAAKSTVLVLAEVEGFSCDEIAEMLSIPVGTVWTRLHHARRELRRFYEAGE